MFKKLFLLLSLVPALGVSAVSLDLYSDVMNALMNVGKKKKENIDSYCEQIKQIFFEIIDSDKLQEILVSGGMDVLPAEHEQLKDIFKQFGAISIDLLRLEVYECLNNKFLSEKEVLSNLQQVLSSLMTDFANQNFHVFINLAFAINSIRISPQNGPQKEKEDLAMFAMELIRALHTVDKSFVYLQESLAEFFPSERVSYAFKEARLSSGIQQICAEYFQKGAQLLRDILHIVTKKILNGTVKPDQNKLDDVKQKAKAIESEFKNKLDALIQGMNARA